MKNKLLRQCLVVAAPLALTSCIELEEGYPYGGGYNHPYTPPPYQSGYYGGGYAPPPQPYYGGYSIEERRRQAYQLGRMLGRDDYHAGRKKSYGRHSSYYDSVTEQAFKDGFYSGYEEARDRDKKKR